MTDATLLYQRDARNVVTVTLNRPEKHNAFDDALIKRMSEAFTQALGDGARVLVLQASGKNFSAGADLGWMKRMAECSHAENRADALALAAMLHQLDTLPMPTVCLARGALYGGAVGLASCCDIVLASDTARFCLSEVRLGLAPAAISPYVIRAMGARQARRYFLSAEEIPASAALALGLAHEVVADTELEEAAETHLNRLLRNGPLALAACKTLIAAAEHMAPGSDQQRYTSDVIAGLRVSPEGQEGLRAFFEKRPPAWVPSTGDTP